MKKLIAIALALVLIAAVSCASAATLTIGATSTPHAEVLEAAQPLLAEKGIELEIVVYTDYVQPNLALDAGELDANYFQHIPYLEDFCKQNGTKLVSAGAVHSEPMGIYAGKSSDLTAIPEGAVIAVPNDTTNEARALRLLQAQGIITLYDDVENPTKLDVKDNPYKIELIESAAEQIPHQLADVDFAVINSNYALQAGAAIVGTAIAVEGTDVSYPNIIAIREGDDRAELATLVEVLQSETIVQWIKDTYGTAVVPTK